MSTTPLYLMDFTYIEDRFGLILYNEENQKFELFKREKQKHLARAYDRYPYDIQFKFKHELDYEPDNPNQTWGIIISPHYDFFVKAKGIKEYVKRELTFRYHPLRHQVEPYFVYFYKSPWGVKEHMSDDSLYENHVKYFTRWAIDEYVTYGMPYTVENEELCPTTIKLDKEQQELKRKLRKLFDNDMVDNFLDLLLAPVTNMPYIGIDIEVLTRGDVVPNSDQATEPITAIGFCFSDKPEIILALDNKTRALPHRFNKELAKILMSKEASVEWFDDEKRLLRRALDIINWKGYRLLVTFNGDGFDLPYIKNRSNYLGLWAPFSVKKKRTKGGRMWTDCHYTPKLYKSKEPDLERWKLHLDLYKFFSQAYIKDYAFKGKYKSSSLDAIGKALLDVGKVEHEEHLNDIPVNDLVYYNWMDVRLIKMLMQMQDHVVMRLIFLLMRLSVEPFSECHRKAVAGKIHNWLLTWVIDKGMISPTRKEMRAHDKQAYKRLAIDVDFKSKFTGAIVIDPNPGFYFDVECRDFTGLYTNTITNKNLSFETMNCGHEECMSNIVPEVGHYVCTKNRGLMSQIVGLLTTSRTLYFKKKAKTDKDFEPVEQVIKVFGNASYGVFGALFFPFFLRIMAESTTAYSRDAIKKIIEKAIELGFFVIYGDTDSVFLSGGTPETVKQLEEYSLNELGLELNLDYDFRSYAISGRKKNYFGFQKDGELVLKGFKIKKRNSPLVITKIGNRVIDFLRDVDDKDKLRMARGKIILYLRKKYSDIWVRSGDLSDYAITTQISRSLSQYKVIGPHVRAAMIEADSIIKGLPKGSGAQIEDFIQAGQLQSYIKSNIEIIRTGTKRSKRMGVVPLHMATKKDIDPVHYHRELVSSMSQIIDVLNIVPEMYKTRDPKKKILLDYFGEKNDRRNSKQRV